MEFDNIIDSIPIEPYYRDPQSDIVIYCSDCRDILKFIPDKSIDLVLTDPPYNVRLADWDRQFSEKELNTLLCLSKGAVAIFGDSSIKYIRYMLNLLPEAERIYIWHNPFTLTHSEDAFWQWQPIYVWGKRQLVGLKKDVLTYTCSDSIGRLHPAQKPEQLISQLILTGSMAGNLILDPFLGSGTTAYCAKKLGRKCIGIEIEEKYCEIAKQRLSQSVMRLGI